MSFIKHDLSLLAFWYILHLSSCNLIVAFIISTLPHVLVKNLLIAGRLRSSRVTSIHCYYTPIRHLLTFKAFPGLAGYSPYLAPDNFLPGVRKVSPVA